jgi:hypothetical protein
MIQFVAITPSARHCPLHAGKPDWITRIKRVMTTGDGATPLNNIRSGR